MKKDNIKITHIFKYPDTELRKKSLEEKLIAIVKYLNEEKGSNEEGFKIE